MEPISLNTEPTADTPPEEEPPVEEEAETVPEVVVEDVGEVEVEAEEQPEPEPQISAQA